MRIGMYMPRLFPGSRSWTLYQDFAAAVRARGHHFEIFTDRPADPTVADDETTHYLPWRAAPASLDKWMAPLTRSPRLLGTVRTLMPPLRRRRDLDLVYVEIAYPYAAAVDLVASMTGWPGAIVVKPTGEDVLAVPEASYGFGRHFIPRTLVARALRRASAIRCISPMVLDVVKRYGSQPRAIIPSAVDNETIAAAEQQADARNRQRAEARRALMAATGASRSRIVMALGRLHPFKGLHYLVEAMADVPDADLILAGPVASVKGFGDYRQFLEAVGRRAGVHERMIFMGLVPHENVLATLAAADVVVVPSILESMNKVCVEAAAVHTPFVVTNTTGVSAYLDEPGVGRVVGPKDSAALAASIRDILDETWSRDDAATRRFVQRFAPRTVAEAACDLFAAALDYKRRQP